MSGVFLLALLPAVTAHAAGGLTIEKPWMRLIIKARPAAGYFTLKNGTDKPVALTGAASSACGMMMLHRSVEENGVEKMLSVMSLTVPAHGSVSFAPGGYHIMCMKPQASMERGKSVPVTLKFADGSSLTAQFPVKGPGDK
jgi:periplasmic copper chaperone A